MSATAFVGSAANGPLATPVRVRGIAEFKREFGALSLHHPLTYAVQQFFENGGRDALIVRIAVPPSDGEGPLTDDLVSAPELHSARGGMWALDKAEPFHLLCIPPFAFGATGDIGAQTRRAAADYCLARRAMFIVDPLAAWSSVEAVLSTTIGLTSTGWGLPPSSNAALYFPHIRVADSARPGQSLDCAPCGAVAGVYARIDAARGVWKAPAGEEAALHAATGLSVAITDSENGPLNARGVNCLRTFRSKALLVWGARTLMGDDALASEWKYVPVRRLALHVERSLGVVIADVARAAADDGIANDEPLWAMLRQQASGFLLGLFRAGAFAGSTPDEAFFVKSDRTTMTQDDIDNGRLIVQVGIAPAKPAEFVVFRIGQWLNEP